MGPALRGTARDCAAAREYGSGGLFGVLTPQGNPVAETELRILLPPQCVLLVGRLVSSSTDLRRRLLDYGEQLDAALGQFAGLALDALGFACTGSSYLTAAVELHRAAARPSRVDEYPVLTAAAAVEAALGALGVDSIALVSPYPSWLTDACRDHWQRRGIRVTASLQLTAGFGQRHGIYELTSARVLEAIAGFDRLGAAGILLAGTGMPSLRTVLQLEPTLPVPVLSSNLCLAWALARLVGKALPGPESRLYGGWAARLAAA